MFETPNLDGLTTDPAQMREAARALALLGRYAGYKAEAMMFRQMGHISVAQQFESRMEEIYNELPEWARW